MNAGQTITIATTASALIVATAAAACVGSQPDAGGLPPDTTDPECQLQSVGERSPGYPFDVERFAADVLPVVTTSCGAAGCHGAPGQGGFSVWAAAAPGNCDYAKTFNAIADQVDLATPKNSRLLLAIDGTSPTHPVRMEATDTALVALSQYVTEASERYIADGNGGDTAPPGASPFDYAVFQTAIQPAMDSAGCATAGCHGTGAGNFTIQAAPAVGGPEMEANFLAVTSRMSLAEPATSNFYLRATIPHAAGASTVVTPADGAAILAWIEAAAEAAGGAGDDATNCPPADRFNLGVFRDEIMPILSGELDLNAPGAGGGRTGCTAGLCHGSERGPGTLSLSTDRTPLKNLESFTCFVDLTSPTRSEILACPLNEPGCRRYPHPGQDTFGGPDDLNYQRLLAFLLGSRLDTTPVDYAYFVRRINPIFNDLAAVENGAQGRTCADTAGCHGVSVVGQLPPNGSNFPIIPNAADSARLAYNFVSAASFVNFLDPDDSSLFLYPTNEIANLAEHPLATGLPHPGGEDFAVDSDEALAILEWAAGLRPDADGFQRNWLVAGDFAATRVSDLTLVQEATVTPAIFDASGGAFNAGQWDGLFSDNGTVDLAAAFPRAQNAGRVAYAVAYLVNLSPFELRTQIEIATDNPVRVYVNDLLVAQNDNGGGATVFATLPPYGTSRAGVRVLVKLLQRAEDDQFEFSARFRDELGTILTNTSGELLIMLGPDGGI